MLPGLYSQLGRGKPILFPSLSTPIDLQHFIRGSSVVYIKKSIQLTSRFVDVVLNVYEQVR